MYCPSCGKDNSLDQKFCAGCGVNLHAVAQALTMREDDFFTKMDAGMDALLARYNEHVFRKPAKRASDHGVVRSWQILGQSVATAIIDLLLFTLMSTLLPIRLILLVISTPFRVLVERKDREEPEALPSAAYAAPDARERSLGAWREEAPSVTEGTTTLFNTGKVRR